MSPEPDSPIRKQGAVARALGAVAQIRPGEGVVVALAALCFYCLMTSYYILRPVRDALGIARGVENLPILTVATLGAMLAVNPVFSLLVSRYTRRRFIPIVYIFFAVNLVAFSLILRALEPGTDLAVNAGYVYFVWVTVFNLFIVTVFWGFMADIFNLDQGKRLYGLIGVGGTIGGVSGAAITAFLTKHTGAFNLLLVSAGLLVAAVLCVRRLSALAPRVGPAQGLPATASPETPREQRALSWRDAVEGVVRIARSPVLATIGVYILLFTITSQILYYHVGGAADQAFPDRDARIQFFARCDLAINIITLTVQLFLTGRIFRATGLTLSLVALPLLTTAGFVVTGALWREDIEPMTLLWVVAVFNVARRSLNFALAKPAREALFTVVPREDKYKSKSLLDTLVYRAGDVVGAGVFIALTGERFLHLSLAQAAYAVAGIAALWTLAAFALGALHRRARHAHS